MSKQIAEKVFKDSAMNHWCPTYVKKFLHVMNAYTPNEADFMVSTVGSLHFVEVKECNNLRFDFERLTQKSALFAFDRAMPHHHGWVFIYFREKMKKNSTAFCIPITEFCEYIDSIDKKSINMNECFSIFSKWHCTWYPDTKTFKLPL